MGEGCFQVPTLVTANDLECSYVNDETGAALVLGEGLFATYKKLLRYLRGRCIRVNNGYVFPICEPHMCLDFVPALEELEVAWPNGIFHIVSASGGKEILSFVLSKAVTGYIRLWYGIWNHYRKELEEMISYGSLEVEAGLLYTGLFVRSPRLCLLRPI
jgi:hypothetical protein